MTTHQVQVNIEFEGDACGECKMYDGHVCTLLSTTGEVWLRNPDQECYYELWLAKRDAANGVDPEKRKLAGAYRIVAYDMENVEGSFSIPDKLHDRANKLEHELEVGNG